MQSLKSAPLDVRICVPVLLPAPRLYLGEVAGIALLLKYPLSVIIFECWPVLKFQEHRPDSSDFSKIF